MQPNVSKYTMVQSFSMLENLSTKIFQPYYKPLFLHLKVSIENSFLIPRCHDYNKEKNGYEISVEAATFSGTGLYEQ